MTISVVKPSRSEAMGYIKTGRANKSIERDVVKAADGLHDAVHASAFANTETEARDANSARQVV